MVSITIEHFRLVPSVSSTGFRSLGLVTLTMPGSWDLPVNLYLMAAANDLDTREIL